MGAPARVEVDGKKVAVPGCKIFVGGQIGEDSHLSLDPIKTGIPIADESLIPELVEILKSEFGAVEKSGKRLKIRNMATKIVKKIKGTNN